MDKGYGFFGWFAFVRRKELVADRNKSDFPSSLIHRCMNKSGFVIPYSAVQTGQCVYGFGFSAAAAAIVQLA